jgi:hypothetical protein
VVDAAVPTRQFAAFPHHGTTGRVLRHGWTVAGMASPAAVMDGLVGAFPELDEFARNLHLGVASSDIERETDPQTAAWNQFVMPAPAAVAGRARFDRKGGRYAAIEGKTREISIDQARPLLASLDTTHVVGLRDRAILAILVYASSRAGGVAKLRCGDFYNADSNGCCTSMRKGESPARSPCVRTCRSWSEPISTRRACATRRRTRRYSRVP